MPKILRLQTMRVKRKCCGAQVYIHCGKPAKTLLLAWLKKQIFIRFLFMSYSANLYQFQVTKLLTKGLKNWSLLLSYYSQEPLYLPAFSSQLFKSFSHAVNMYVLTLSWMHSFIHIVSIFPTRL